MAKILAAKAPGERIDYLWSPPIQSGDEITGSATVSLVAGSATLDSATVETDKKSVKLWFTLGTDGETSEFAAAVTTTAGRTFQEQIYLPVHVQSLSTDALSLVQIFREFAQVSPEVLDYWIEVATGEAPAGEQHIKLLLACHYLSLQGYGQQSAIPFGVTRFKSGSVDIAMSDKSGSGFRSTKYGQQYLDIIRRKFAGPRVYTGAGLS